MMNKLIVINIIVYLRHLFYKIIKNKRLKTTLWKDGTFAKHSCPPVSWNLSTLIIDAICRKLPQKKTGLSDYVHQR